MPIEVTCDECFSTMNVPEKYAGKRLKCKSCGGTVSVPAADVDQSDEADEWRPAASARLPPKVRSARKKADEPRVREVRDDSVELERDNSSRGFLGNATIGGVLITTLLVGLRVLPRIMKKGEGGNRPAAVAGDRPAGAANNGGGGWFGDSWQQFRIPSTTATLEVPGPMESKIEGVETVYRYSKSGYLLAAVSKTEFGFGELDVEQTFKNLRQPYGAVQVAETRFNVQGRPGVEFRGGHPQKVGVSIVQRVLIDGKTLISIEIQYRGSEPIDVRDRVFQSLKFEGAAQEVAARGAAAPAAASALASAEEAREEAERLAEPDEPAAASPHDAGAAKAAAAPRAPRPDPQMLKEHEKRIAAARERMTKRRAQRDADSGPEAEARAVKSTEDIKPGTPLDAEWGRTWRPVVVIAEPGDAGIKIHWLGWGDSSDEVLPLSRLRFPDESQGIRIGPETKLQAGMQVEYYRPSGWEPVTIVQVNKNGFVRIHWEGRPDAFDKEVPQYEVRVPSEQE